MTTAVTRYDDLPPMRDHALRLTIIKPGSYYDVVGSVKWAYDIEATWRRREPSVLAFKTRKDAPGADRLMEDYEIVVHVWDPRRQQWIQPPNSRFVIDTWQEDLVDGTNVIQFTAQQTVTLLDKVVLWPAAGYSAMNKRLDSAKSAHEKAKSAYDSASRTFQNQCKRVAKGAGLPRDKHRKYHARKGIVRLTAAERRRWGHINVNVNNGRIFWYSVARGKWVRMKMRVGSSSAAQTKERDRAELVKNARKVVTTRNHLAACSKRLDAATRGARETSRDGTRYFYRSTPGRTINKAWNEGVKRDRSRGMRQPPGRINWQLKGLLRSWTSKVGSKGGTWGSIRTTSHEFKLGTGLFTMMQDFTERGLMDWRVRHRTVELVGHGRLEVDQTNRVALHLGQDVTEAVTKGSLSEHASHVLVTGDGSRAYNLVWNPRMSSNKTGWGFLEASMSDSAAKSRSQARQATTDARGEMTRRRQIESSRGLTLTPNSTIPMIDYEPHHLISVYDYNGRQMARRVDQVTLTVDGDGLTNAVVTFGKRFSNAAVRFDRSISKTMGGVTHMQGHIPLDQSAPPEEKRVSATTIPGPPLLGVDTRVRFNNLTGEPSVVVSPVWDTDSAAIVQLLSSTELWDEVDEDEEADPSEVEPGAEESDEPFDETTEGVLAP